MPITAKLFQVSAVSPAMDLIAGAAEQLAGGKIGVLPTRCLYGLGTNALDPGAVKRIFAIKKRPPQKPLLVLISQIGQLKLLATDISSTARKLMQRLWPGQVTFLLNARPGLPPGLVGPDNKIGIRLVGHPVAAALAARARVPLTGTSANISNRPGCHRIDQMDADILSAVDLVVDAGPLLGGIGSSIVDATLPVPSMVRHGLLGEKDFRKALADMR